MGRRRRHSHRLNIIRGFRRNSCGLVFSQIVAHNCINPCQPISGFKGEGVGMFTLFDRPLVLGIRKRKFSIFREHQNRFLKQYAAGLDVSNVLNLGAMPNATDKEGSKYEAYFPEADFRTLDLGENADPRHTQADLMALPDAFPQFDLVLAMSVIEHIDRPWLAAPHIASVVRPGGYLYIAMPFFYPVHEGPYYGDHWRCTPSAMGFLFPDLEVVRFDLYPTSICAVRDRKTYWRDPANTYSGFSMLLRKPA
jgi:SAM-dependent methyltransferase